ARAGLDVDRGEFSTLYTTSSARHHIWRGVRRDHETLGFARNIGFRLWRQPSRPYRDGAVGGAICRGASGGARRGGGRRQELSESGALPPIRHRAARDGQIVYGAGRRTREAAVSARDRPRPG